MDIQFRSSTLLVSLCAALVMTTTAQAQQAQCPGYGYGPQCMWQQLTPEQQRQMLENMHRWVHGPGYGMGMGMGRGMMGPGMMWGPGYAPLMTPEQYKNWYERHQRGYGPGMMHQLTPEQRQQMWEQMHRQGYGPWGMQPPAAEEPPAK